MPFVLPIFNPKRTKLNEPSWGNVSPLANEALQTVNWGQSLVVAFGTEVSRLKPTLVSESILNPHEAIFTQVIFFWNDEGNCPHCLWYLLESAWQGYVVFEHIWNKYTGVYMRRENTQDQSNHHKKRLQSVQETLIKRFKPKSGTGWCMQFNMLLEPKGLKPKTQQARY
jgi:hypothetical protein